MKQHFKNYSLLYTSLFIGVIYLIPNFAHAFSDPVQVQIGATNHPIRNVWTALLDFANVVALIFFLGIAFANLLRIQISVYGIKKILPSLIVGIILANFSLLICQLLLDLSGAAAGLFEPAKGFLGYWLSDAKTFGTTTDDNFVREIISALLKFAAAIMTMILAIMFLLRNYILMFLVVFSPIAFLSMALPATKALWTRWWKAFSQWTFMLPVAMFWLWVGANFFQFTDQFNSTEVAFFTGISFAGYAFGMICVYLAMTTPFKMAGELQSIAKKVQSTALTGLGVYAGVRWAQNRAESTKAHIINATPIGNLVRGAQKDTAASKAKMDRAMAGGAHHEVGKFSLPEWKMLGKLAGKQMAVSDTWKWFRPLSAIGLGTKGHDRFLDELEVSKNTLEAEHKLGRAQDSGVKGRYGRARRRRATTAEQAKEKEKEAATDERMKLMFGEDYREYETIDDAMKDESYIRFHNTLQNTAPNDFVTLYRAIRQGFVEKTRKELLEDNPNLASTPAGQAQLQRQLLQKLQAKFPLTQQKREETVYSYLKQHDEVLQGSRKLNQSLNGQDKPAETVEEIQGLVKQYKGTNEGTRAVDYRQAVNQQKLHELVVKNREDETLVSDTMNELHKMLQGQELNQLLDELGKTTSDIEKVIQGQITPIPGRQKDLEEKLWVLVRQMRRKGEDLSTKAKVTAKAQAYRDKVRENPDLISVMQLRMHHNVVGSWIGEKAKGDAESESAVETFDNLLEKFSLDELGHLMAGDLSSVAPDKVLWFQRGTQTAAKSMAGDKRSPEYGQFLTGLANYLGKARNAKGVNGKSLEDRIGAFLISVSPQPGRLATALASKSTVIDKYDELIKQIKNAAGSSFRGDRDSIATYLSQIGINENLAVGRTPVLNRNNLVEGEKNLLRTNF